MKEAALPLAERIRDIRLPPPHFWWPPAPGWWMVAGGVLLLAALLYWRHRRRTALRRAALRELRRLRRERFEGRRLAMEVEMLLRRVAMARQGSEKVSALHGDRWLELLDRMGGTRDFAEGVGRVLIEAPWRPGSRFDRQALLELAETWLERAT